MGLGAGHSVDEYLETIYFLAFPIGEYRPTRRDPDARLARRGDARRLARVGRRDAEAARGRGARRARRAEGGAADRPGRERAEHVVRKHRIIERLLTDFMGYTAAEAHVHADELGDTFSDDMVERIEEQLGNPDRCPHGWPVDPDVRAGGEPRARAALRPRAGRRGRRSSASPSTTASSCTGSTTRASSPGTSVELARGRAGRRSVHGRLNGDERESARRPPPGRSCGARRRPGSGRTAEAGGSAERVGLVGLLPGEVAVVAAEVAVRGGLRVDRAAQVEVAHDRGRAQVEVLADELLDPRDGTLLGAEALDEHRHGCATPIA